MNTEELSKRWMATFNRERALNNVQFFETGLNTSPIVHVFWDREYGQWKAWGYIVAEEGHNPWDITEPHFSSAFSTSRKQDACSTTFTAEEFRKAVKDHPAYWYTDGPAGKERDDYPWGKLSWQPFDRNRGLNDKEGFSYIHCVYKKVKP